MRVCYFSHSPYNRVPGCITCLPVGAGKAVVATDVMWSDPASEPGLVENEARGVGLLFGPDVTQVRSPWQVASYPIWQGMHYLEHLLEFACL